MIHDRTYMKEPSWRDGNVSVVQILLILNLAVFFIEGLATLFTGGFGKSPVTGFIDTWLALSLQGLKSGYLWQFITYQFLHADLLHILFNMLALWFFGRSLERSIGPSSLLKVYLLSGVAGGIVQVALAWAAPQFFGGFVVGASAATFGLVAAFAMIEPHRQITTLLFMVIPVTFRAIAMFWGALILSLLGIVAAGEKVAHGAHLGGLLFGAAFIKWIWTQEWSVNDWFARFKPARRPAPRIIPVTATKLPPAPTPEQMTPDYIAREVDPILDKISAHGIQSLTDREKKILEAARSKMAKK